jgi:tripartite-type tricarboxylate transporter receptor subunit TctC
MKSSLSSISRRAAAITLLAGTAMLANTAVLAQANRPVITFPTKPLRIVVPFAAGGVADLTARTVGQRLAEQLGQNVVVENRPGAGGIVAGEAVARAEPDGHTLLLMSNGNAVSANLFKTLPFDVQKDFTPISTLGSFDLVVVTAAESPHKTMAQLLAHARANPGKMNVGSINIGSTQNLSAEWLLIAANLQATVIPYNGTPAVVTALRGNQVDAGVEVLGPVLGQLRAGSLRALAVLGSKRAPQLPDVPTLQETGVSGLVATSWNGLAAPAKTPTEIVNRLQKEIAAALANPDVAKRLRELNVEPHASTPAEAAELLASEIKRWGEVIQKAKIAKQ